ncbi:aminotransferase class I/II-fold pyridoxal phosphate-dependent enzyme [Thauera sp. SDU_THAU2]|uniref:aminotransferase class I/II-fold pyridoxal phosphate-dependent enzyme n=1 Tax=Thauera sp. SDU_THAU2 TaxID=3136633 RepID=UPI00311FE53D
MLHPHDLCDAFTPVPHGFGDEPGRRRELLELARNHGGWIVEDDYDSEFRFAGRPVPAMQGLEVEAPVVYIGSFSKTLFPALRVGYMVLPKALAAAFRTVHADLYREGTR